MAGVTALAGNQARRVPEGEDVRRERMVVHAPEAEGGQVAAAQRRTRPVPLRRRPSGAEDLEPRRGRAEQPNQGAAALASGDIKKPAHGAGVLVPGVETGGEKTPHEMSDSSFCHTLLMMHSPWEACLVYGVQSNTIFSRH